MTLILTAMHRHVLVQIVDRLVTQTVNGRIADFDPQSNKTVLFGTRDGFLTIAYTGLAYINELPTDHWIAETLRGLPVRLGRDGIRPAALSMGRVANWPTIGRAIQRLKSGLEGAIATLRPMRWRTEPLSIVIAGWQLYRKKRPRVFALEIEKAAGRNSPVISRLPRHIGVGWRLLAAPSGHLSLQEGQALVEAIGSGNGGGADHAMVAAIREVSARTNLVGPHCMCVIVPAPQFGWMQVRYDSPTVQEGYLISKRGTRRFPKAFAPWILTEDLTMAPSILSGGGTKIQVGYWLLNIEETLGVGDSNLSVQSAQQRRPQPR
jgi:hypothetical protein